MDGIDLKELKELVEFLKANEIAEFDLEKGDLKLRVKSAGSVAVQPTGAQTFDFSQLARMLPQGGPTGQPGALSPVATGEEAIGSTSSAGPVSGVAAEKLHTVKSPIVGTFYEAPSPGAPPFVKAGDVVEVGQVLCIVEAMKLMNEIEADAAGEIVERVANPGQPVEYGQSLFTIRPR